MDDAGQRVKCPLCEGQGELLRTQLAQKWNSAELRQRLDARIAEILSENDLATAAMTPRNFQKEVHEWNPQLPMWRRSPKE